MHLKGGKKKRQTKNSGDLEARELVEVGLDLLL